MNRFKQLRIEHGYETQAALAKELFVNQTAVSQWERGVTTPSPTILLKLSKMYGVSTDYLLGNEDKKRAATQESDGPADDDARLLRLLTKADPDLKKAMIDFLEKAQK